MPFAFPFLRLATAATAISFTLAVLLSIREEALVL